MNSRYQQIVRKFRSERAARKIKGYLSKVIPRTKDLTFYGGPKELVGNNDLEVVLSGPADTGKTLACLYKLNQIAWNYPNSSLAIVRKIASSMRSTVLETYHTKILPYPPEDERCPVRAYGGAIAPKRYIYPNGSVIWLWGMDKPGKALSAERDIVYVNQAEELTVIDWEILGTRCTGRAGHVDHPQLIGDCNPAQANHWILQRRKAKSLVFLEALHTHNPQLYDQETMELTPSGIVRLGRLENLTGTRRARLYKNLWVMAEGAIYEHYDDDKNKIVSVDLPFGYPRVVGIDPMGAQIAAVFLAFDNDARKLHVYDEYYQPFGVTTTQHASNMLAMVGDQPIMAWVAGQPAERQARVDFMGAGIPVISPEIADVWSGIDKIQELLRDGTLVIHDRCVNLLEEITTYTRVMNRDGVVTEKIKNKDAYHCLDALRYVIVWLTSPVIEESIIYDRIRIY